MNIIINKINFIKCKYEIKKDDVGKEIQIISGKNSYGEYKNKEILKEMKIIINGEIKSNINYKFNKEGIYIIYLLSFNLLTNMSWMFYGCSSLIEINLQSFNTNKVTSMSSMFYGCSSLIEIKCEDKKILGEYKKIKEKNNTCNII